VAAVNRIDNLKTGIAWGCGAWGQINEHYRVYARTMGFHVDACEVRSPKQKGKTERRVGDCKGLDVQGQRFDGLAGLQTWTDLDRAARAIQRICPATGLSVAESWEAEKPFLRLLPELLPEPFDLVRTAPVHKDCTVHFDGRSYVVPFTHVGRDVEVRGCSGRVQIVDPQTAAVLISYPRHTQERILIDPACYEGPGTAGVLPPKPLGRMAKKLQEIASLAVERPVRRTDGGGPMTLKGGSHEPEKSSALPARAATADLRTLVDQLVKLGLDFAAEALPAILTRAVKEDMGSPALLEQLLKNELERREERRIRTSLRLSGLPTGQTLANFDFAFQPAVQRSKLNALWKCSWLSDKQVLLILGPPGVGKTHLAIGLGVRAVESGFSVAFFRLEELLHAMRKDADVPPTRLKGKKYMKAGLVIIDEVGFETFTREEANLFFRLVSYRYQRGSLCITSNKAIKDWPEMLAGDEVIATAILDDVLDLLDQLVTAALSRVERAGQQRRLRSLKDLDSAALLLHQACLVLLDPGCTDRLVRENVFARVPQDQLTRAVAQVAELVGPADDHYFEDLRTGYSQVRRFLPAFLEAVEFAATDAGRPATEAFGFLKTIEGQKRPGMRARPLRPT
jgi:DNA replication protein DnaC